MTTVCVTAEEEGISGDYVRDLINGEDRLGREVWVFIMVLWYIFGEESVRRYAWR